MTTFYQQNHLRPNPENTQVCAFHLRNKHAHRQLRVKWGNIDLEHCPTPKYLGVTLDRSLTYKKHCTNTKHKVAARNNIIRKLTGSSWGAQPGLVRTSALALCFSTAEYACPVWYNSTHAKQVDVALNATCRIVTGCMKPTPIDKLQCLAGIAPPSVRREAAAKKERANVDLNESHPLHGHRPPRSRLKSRKGFMTSTNALETQTQSYRLNTWKDKTKHLSEWMSPAENLPPGGSLNWITWRSLNRLRSGVCRTKDNLSKWGFLDDPSNRCDCGAVQTTDHLYNCPLCPESCSLEDLLLARDNAVDVARYWSSHS